VKLGWVPVVGAMAIGLSGCGSSPRRSYSVGQVESAFAAHGITLRERRRTTGEVVSLVGRGGVRVLVVLGAPNWSFGWTGERPLDRGNLVVFRPPAYTQAVSGALQDLH
jgi:hypothetical protein